MSVWTISRTSPSVSTFEKLVHNTWWFLLPSTSLLGLPLLMSTALLSSRIFRDVRHFLASAMPHSCSNCAGVITLPSCATSCLATQKVARVLPQ